MDARDGHLPGTAPLQDQGDFAARMVAGLSAYLDRQLAAADAQAGAALAVPRSPHEHQAAAGAAREGIARRIGVVDARVPFDALELVGTTAAPALLAATGAYANVPRPGVRSGDRRPRGVQGGVGGAPVPCGRERSDG